MFANRHIKNIQGAKPTAISCNYRNGTIECRGDGYLWDADSDGYDLNEHSEPCPCCNTESYLLDKKEGAETTSYFFSMADSGSGVDIWKDAVQHAIRWNRQAAVVALRTIKQVHAIYDDPADDRKTLTQVFDYK